MRRAAINERTYRRCAHKRGRYAGAVAHETLAGATFPNFRGFVSRGPCEGRFCARGGVKKDDGRLRNEDGERRSENGKGEGERGGMTAGTGAAWSHSPR